MQKCYLGRGAWNDSGDDDDDADDGDGDEDEDDDDDNGDDDNDDDDDRNVWEVNSEVGGGQVIGREETPLLLSQIHSSVFVYSVSVFLYLGISVSTVFLFCISLHCIQY